MPQARTRWCGLGLIGAASTGHEIGQRLLDRNVRKTIDQRGLRVSAFECLVVAAEGFGSEAMARAPNYAPDDNVSVAARLSIVGGHACLFQDLRMLEPDKRPALRTLLV
jgi:hypothetical protein